MHCDRCGRANRPSARFCSGCGAALAVTCPACGNTVEPDARFCDACAAPLTAPAPAVDDARKVVTIVFADLAGSTPLQERLDPESARQLMDAYYAALRSAVADHRGTVVKLLGDGVMAAFGVPQVAEDDAERAVRAASAMQDAFTRVAAARPGLAVDFGLRVGVNTGEVVVTAGDDDVVGDPVNVAARLQEHAGLGEVLLGESTRRLVEGRVSLEPAGELSLKGRAERVMAHRLVSLDPPVAGTSTRLIGRDQELDRLARAVDDVASAGSARLTMVLGSPGLGKTRLLTELAQRVADQATVLFGRCEATGVATFAPVAEALREYAGIGDAVPADTVRAAVSALLSEDEPDRERVVDRVSSVLGTGSPGSPEETFWAMRRVLASIARHRPVVLVLDDLHWAEPLLLDLVEHVVEWSRDVPLLVLGAARPELRDSRSSLASPGGLAELIVLDALDAGAATRLAADVLGAQELPAAVAGRVLAASEGNPLFVRELVRMLVEDEVLRRDGDRWVATEELADVAMPPTIHALLAARLERLRPEQRAVIERAAIVGRQFTRAALDHLLPNELAPDLDAHLEALRRSELVEPDGTWFLGDPVMRFHHALIRDAAYRRLLKGTRAELHERYADWLAGRIDDAVPDSDDMLGWHLEQAHSYFVELGADDEHTRELGSRAASHLATAGKAALERDDLTAAASLLGRALDRIDHEDPRFAELQLDRCEALLSAGEVGTARHAVETLEWISSGSIRLIAWHTAFASQLAVLTEPERLPEIVEAVAPATEALRDVGDVTGQAKAHYVHAMALARLGQVGAAESELDHALAAARSAGDRRLANAVLSGAPLAALWGPSPVTRASGRCLDVVRVLRITAGAPAVEAVALRCQAVLEALRGRVDAARRMIGSARRTLEELGLMHRLLETQVFAGLIELYDDDAVAAESCLAPAYEELRRRGLGGEAAQAAALLARALLIQGRDQEAEKLGHEAEALAGADLRAAVAWRGVRAEAAARHGEYATALDLAREAVELASTTDALLDHADARLALASVLERSGDTTSATAEARRAAELYEAKGATVLAERARGDGSPAPVPSQPPAEPDEPKEPVRFENVAVRAVQRSHEAWERRDWDAYAGGYGATFRFVDRHAVAQTEVTRDEFLASMREPFDFSERATTVEILATRGDRLVLVRESFRGHTRVIGESETEQLEVTEVDDEGRFERTAWFDAHDLDAAYDELDTRFAAGEGAAHRDVVDVIGSFRRIVSERDWEALGDLFDPTFVVEDHRPVGWGTLHLFEYLESMRAMLELAADATLRVDHVLAADPHSALIVGRTVGSVDEAPFEHPFLAVWELNPGHRIAHWDSYALDQLDEAWARYRALDASSAFENDATRALRDGIGPWDRRDWEAAAATFAPSYRNEDRRLHTTVDREELLVGMRHLFDMEERHWSVELLATRGDRLALFRIRFNGHDRSVGPTEAEYLDLVESDGSGRRLYEIMLDPDDLDASYDELNARFAAGEGAAVASILQWETAMRHAARDRRWERFEANFEADFVASDHRPLGWGELRGAEYFESLKNLLELAPDAGLWTDHILAIEPCKALSVNRNAGTRVGSAFENVIVIVSEFTGARCRRWDIYARDELEEAWARYHEIDARPRFENLASRNMQRFIDAWARRDWDAYTGMFSPEYRHHDHRAVGSGELRRDEHLASTRVVLDEGWMVDGSVLATRGDRLMLYRVRWHGRSGPSGDSELEVVGLDEVDEQGRILTTTLFDPDDLDAAYDELDERYAAGEGAPVADVIRLGSQFFGAHSRREWDAMREVFAPKARVEDHRPMGWGELAVDGYVDMLRNLTDMAPDVRNRLQHVLAAEEQRALFVNAAVGTLDGGPFEISIAVVVKTSADQKVVELEMYDLADLEDAWSRYRDHEAPPTFENEASRLGRRISVVGAEPLRFENLATRQVRAFVTAWNDRDWDAMMTLLGPEQHQFDRRAHAQLELDHAGRLADMRMQFDAGLRITAHEVLATRGQHLALFRSVLASSDEDVEFPFLILEEVDESGHEIFSAVFDPDDLDAAYAELDDRFEQLERTHPAGTVAVPPNTAVRVFEAITATFDARAPEGYRRICRDDFVMEDRANHLTLDLEGWIADARFVTEGIPDVRYSTDVVATAGARLALLHHQWKGTVRGGGPFTTEMIQVVEVDDDERLVAVVKLDPAEHVEAVLELLRRLADQADFGVAATASLLREFATAVYAKDWDAWRALLDDRFVVRDHRVSGLGDIGPDEWVGIQRVMSELSPDVMITPTELLAIGAHGLLNRVQVEGTLEDGGPFESHHLDLFTVTGGRMTGLELFDPDEVSVALARFEALRPKESVIPHNLAARAWARQAEAFDTEDWEAFRATYEPTAHIEERRTGTRMVYDLEGHVESFQFVVAGGGRLGTRLLATAGDHLALHRLEFSGGRGGEWQIAMLNVVEVDHAGRITAAIAFDLDDGEAAALELMARFRRGEGAAHAGVVDQLRSLAAARVARDWEAFGGHLAEGLAIDDRRHAGLGWIEGRDAYVTTVKAIHELAPDLRTELAAILALDRHGALMIMRNRGHTADGGAFETEYICLWGFDGDEIVRIEMFELDDEHAALDRFESLRPCQAPIVDFEEAFAARDWEALRRSLSDDFVATDHRPAWMGSSAAHEYVESMRVFAELSPDVTSEAKSILASADHGRVALTRVSGTQRDAGPFENVFVWMLVTEGSKVRTIEVWDADARDEALARFEDLRP